ncbi:MAG: hypothetical protein Q7S12_02500 [bacterium]|nr:hypothetical protein [bacterium]
MPEIRLLLTAALLSVAQILLTISFVFITRKHRRSNRGVMLNYLAKNGIINEKVWMVWINNAWPPFLSFIILYVWDNFYILGLGFLIVYYASNIGAHGKCLSLILDDGFSLKELFYMLAAHSLPELYGINLLWTIFILRKNDIILALSALIIILIAAIIEIKISNKIVKKISRHIIRLKNGYSY